MLLIQIAGIDYEQFQRQRMQVELCTDVMGIFLLLQFTERAEVES